MRLVASYCLNPWCGKRRPRSVVGSFCSKRCATDDRLEPFRQGANDTCVDCDLPALGGGVWCFYHWQDPDRYSPRRIVIRRLRHREPPRCRDCGQRHETVAEAIACDEAIYGRQEAA